MQALYIILVEGGCKVYLKKGMYYYYILLPNRCADSLAEWSRPSLWCKGVG